MTDCFALLDQPRQPWLDLEKLKQAFHEKTRHAHPDARAQEANAAEANSAFAGINEAFQVLQDPKRRLFHFLSLEGHPPSSAGGAVPQEVADVFQTVANATQEAERVILKASGATSPLSRSLIQSEWLQAHHRIEDTLSKLSRLRQEADAELRVLHESFAKTSGHPLERLQSLYLRFSYLTRWISQLEEKRTQLAL